MINIALDHPNIVTIHSVEESDGLHFITMQLVEGEMLSELIPKKGMALNAHWGQIAGIDFFTTEMWTAIGLKT